MTLNSSRIFVARAPIVLLAGALSLWSMPALAQARPERLPDKDVKTLIEQVDNGRDKFEGNLDGSFKGSTVRGPNGDVQGLWRPAGLSGQHPETQGLLHPRLRRRTPRSLTVLRQSTAIDKFMQGSPSSMKGRSEWDEQATNLRHLAERTEPPFRFRTEPKPTG